MKHYKLQYLLIPFTVLTYLVQLLMLPFYKPSSIRWRAGCFELVDNTPNARATSIWGRPGAQSIGIRVIFFNLARDREPGPLAIHERVHTLHGEWCNTLGHLLFVPLAIALGLPWWAGALAGQATFGLLYGGHFFILWALSGFGPWHESYLRIWSERIAYRVDDEWERGLRPGAWGE